MQTRSEICQARSFLWRYLAAAFTSPDETIWSWLTDQNTLTTLPSAADGLNLGATPMPRPASADLADHQAAYLAAFGPTVRGNCPPYEIEYGELKAGPLFQPHRLADIAAFYSAFGLEVADDADERVDHIAMECEFFAVLCAKEAAAEAEGSEEHVQMCRDAQKKFLREHLGRWSPAFSRRLARLTDDRFLQPLAEFLRACVLAECERAGIAAGNDDLQLRPADEPIDACGECGLKGLQTAEAASR